MQSQKEKELKSKTKKASLLTLQKENGFSLLEELKLTAVIPDKLTLLDWYYLLLDEEEDLNLMLYSDNFANNLSNSCLKSFISHHLITFTVNKTKRDILRFFQYLDINPSYNKDCKWKRIKTLSLAESDEPKTLSLGSLSTGLQDVIFSLEGEKTESSSISIVTESLSNCQLEFSMLPPQTLSLLGSSRVLRKHSARDRKLRRDTIWPKDTISKIPLSIASMPIAEEKLQNDKEETTKLPPKTKVKKTGKLLHVLSPRHDSSKGLFQTKADSHSLAARRLSIKKNSFMKQGVSKTFERIDLSHPTLSRIKTGYVIKDSEVTKDSASFSARRSPYSLKRSSDMFTESKERLGASMMYSNIMTMPPLVENISTLTNGVSIIQNGVKKTSIRAPVQHRIDVDTPMHVLKMERKEPKLKVSQLLDPKRPPVIQRPLKL